MDRIAVLQRAIKSLRCDEPNVTSYSDAVTRVQAAVKCVVRSSSTASPEAHHQSVSYFAARDVGGKILVEAFRTIPRAVVKFQQLLFKKHSSNANTMVSASSSLLPSLLCWARAIANFSASLLKENNETITTNEQQQHQNDVGVECTRTVSCLLQLAAATSQKQLLESATLGALQGSPQKFILKMNSLVKIWILDNTTDNNSSDSDSSSSCCVLPRSVLWPCFFVRVCDEVCRIVVEQLLNEMMPGAASHATTAEELHQLNNSVLVVDQKSRMGAETIASVVSEQATRFCEVLSRPMTATATSSVAKDDGSRRADGEFSCSVSELGNVMALRNLVKSM